MTWSTLPAYSDGNAFTAAQVTAIKDNINETAPSKATTSGRHFVATGTNAIAERVISQDYIATSGTTTNTSFVNLGGGGGTGPTLTATTGVLSLVCVQCQVNNTNGGASSRMSFDVSGATTSSATDDRGLLDQNSSGYDNRYGTWELQTLTGGSNTFTSKYRVSSGTGQFSARTMLLIAL